MKRVWLPLALVALSAFLASPPAGAQSCSMGGHNETSENFGAGGGWTTVNMTPGTVVGAPSGTHLIFTEIAPRSAGGGALSDSSEYTVTFVCDGVPGVTEICAQTCQWGVTGVLPNTANVDFGIYATAPNPTNADMLIGFAMPKAGNVRIDIYDLSGKRVRTLLDGPAAAGVNTVRWDGRGEGNRVLAPGACFLRLRMAERIASKKVLLVR